MLCPTRRSCVGDTALRSFQRGVQRADLVEEFVRELRAAVVAPPSAGSIAARTVPDEAKAPGQRHFAVCRRVFTPSATRPPVQRLPAIRLHSSRSHAAGGGRGNFEILQTLFMRNDLHRCAEQAERMAGRVKQHADVRLWLVAGNSRASPDRPRRPLHQRHPSQSRGAASSAAHPAVSAMWAADTRSSPTISIFWPSGDSNNAHPPGAAPRHRPSEKAFVEGRKVERLLGCAGIENGPSQPDPRAVHRSHPHRLP